MNGLLAAIKSVPGAAPAAPAVERAPELRDIVPVVPLPVAWWQWGLLVLGAVLLFAAIIWAVRRWWPSTPPAPPPSPRQIALRALENLRGQVRTLDPHKFSFAVSEVLRRFLEGQFGTRALEQTSDEFLAEIARSARFSPKDRSLLGDFLERSDMIKFARQGVEESASEALLESAWAFVNGGAA